jgi:hypothetical protein
MAQVVTCLASNPKSSSSTPVLLKKKKSLKWDMSVKGVLYGRENQRSGEAERKDTRG